MKQLIIAAMALALVACAPHSEDRTGRYTSMPPELKDCKVYQISDGQHKLDVVRCPISITTTTAPAGKTTNTTVVIDGTEYVSKQ